MSKPMIAVEGFDVAVAELGDSPAVTKPLAALLVRLGQEGERWPALPGSTTRVIRSHKHPDLLPLSIYYRVEGEVIYLDTVRRSGG